MESRIPIQNLYYLLTYAWDCLEEGGLVDVSGIESSDLADLYASVMLSGVRHLLRRGLEQTYVPVEAELAGVRGRIQVAASTRRMLPQHGRMLCEYDELSVDTLPNRILLATVRRLIEAPGLDRRLHDELRALSRSLGGVRSVHLHKQLFRMVQLHGNNGFYRFLLNLCELILDTSLSTEEEGQYRFREFVRDPKRMPALFEAFVYNFYRRECPEVDVRSECIRWAATSEDDPDLSFLPRMQTDISLRTPGRTLIIDTKFYQQTLQKRFGSESVHSANLYQLYSYLRNLEPRGGADAMVEGVLLYPVVDRALRLRYVIGGHALTVQTVNLAASWWEIREELLGVVVESNGLNRSHDLLPTSGPRMSS